MIGSKSGDLLVLIGHATGAMTVWELAALVRRVDALKGEARRQGMIALGRSLVRIKKYLDVGEALLVEADSFGPSFWALDGLAEIAMSVGRTRKGKTLRALAESAPDAPSELEQLQSEWARRASGWKKKSNSKQARRARLDMYFRARSRIGNQS